MLRNDTWNQTTTTGGSKNFGDSSLGEYKDCGQLEHMSVVRSFHGKKKNLKRLKPQLKRFPTLRRPHQSSTPYDLTRRLIAYWLDAEGSTVKASTVRQEHGVVKQRLNPSHTFPRFLNWVASKRPHPPHWAIGWACVCEHDKWSSIFIFTHLLWDREQHCDCLPGKFVHRI